MNILVTGGSGFIGSNFIKHTLRTYQDCNVTNLDKLTYAGNSNNLGDLPDPDRYRFVRGDVNDKRLVERLFDEYAITAVVNFAAESHVDRSFANPSLFVKTNTVGTQTLLDAANRHSISKFVHISTDEVYGALSDEGYFNELSPISPNNPYAASKAGADLIALSYFRTYGTPVNIVRFANTYGPHQHPEKLIPMTILCAIEELPIKVHGLGSSVRDWLHVFDNVTAIDRVLHAGAAGEIYNIGASQEVRCLDVVRAILKKLGKSDDLIEFVPDRLCQDYRYANDSSKIQRELRWAPVYEFESGIEQTIQWYEMNRSWWKPLLSGGAPSADNRKPEARKELVR